MLALLSIELLTMLTPLIKGCINSTTNLLNPHYITVVTYTTLRGTNNQEKV